jgi:hypothetical protein
MLSHLTYERYFVMKTYSWQERLAIVSLLLLIMTGFRTWIWNEWRMDSFEQFEATTSAKIERNTQTLNDLDKKMTVLIAYMQHRGWIDADLNMKK